MSSIFIEKVVEVEKLKVVRGKEEYSKLYLDALRDSPPWFEVRSGRAITGVEEISLPIGWVWSSNWKISMTEPGADSEGWVKDEKSSLRRRWWNRKREKIVSATTSQAKSTTTSSEVSKKDDTDALQSATEAMRRLDQKIQALSIASERTTIEKLTKEASEAIMDAEASLEALANNQQPSARANRIKLSNDLLKDRKRFELVKAEAMSRSSMHTRANNTVNALRRASTEPPSIGVFDNDNDSKLQQQAMIDKQQQQLLQMQQEHRQTMSYEIDANLKMIEERHEKLVEVNRDVHTVNAMMQDIARLVGEQDINISKIKDNTQNANDSVKKGLNQVEKSQQYQQEGGCAIM